MRSLFLASLVFGFSVAIAQDAPYDPQGTESAYSSGYSKNDESAQYELKRDNWRYNNQIRNKESGGLQSYYGGGNLRTPDAPPDVTRWNDYGKKDAWKKSTTKADELVCREKFNEVQKMQADLDGLAYNLHNGGKLDYHSYIAIINENSARMRGSVWKIQRYAATGTAAQCEEEKVAASKVFTNVWQKMHVRAHEFSTLRQIP